MQTYQTTKVGKNKGAPRVWLQGDRCEKAGFNIGQRYKRERDGSRIRLVISSEGTHVVSMGKRAEKTFPVIDLNSADLLHVFEGLEQVRVIIAEGVIHILPLASDIRELERNLRLEQKLKSGAPISTGSLSHGGGVLSLAVHEGLKQGGVESELVFANDIREDMLNQASRCNPAWNDKTTYLNAPMQELAFDPWAMEKVPKCEVLETGIPCSGGSIAGRSKLGLKHAEDHPEVGHLVVAFLNVIARVNPNCILLECVTQYLNTGSMAIIRNQLRDWHYEVHETVLHGEDFNALEHRKRMCMVAVTRGMKFDFANMQLPEKVERTIAEILEPIAPDDPRWSPMTGLKAKEVRDKEAGKGFAMQIVKPTDTKIGTLTKSITKNRSTDPKIANESNPDLLRNPTPLEHARCKGIDEKLIEGACATFAHELLGQSVIPAPFVEVGRLLAESIRSFRIGKDVVEQPFLLVA